MLITGIIITLVAIGLFIIFTSIAEDSSDIGSGASATIVLILGIVLIAGGISENNPQKKSLKDYSYKVEIKSEIINGLETSRDTVYIFTPKKK